MLKIGKSPESEHVRDCLIWHYGGSAKGARQRTPLSRPASGAGASGYDVLFPSNEYSRHMAGSPGNSTLGKAKSYGHEIPMEAHARPRGDEGTVIEALRGWPGYRYEQQGRGMHCSYEQDPIGATGPVTDSKKDPFMVDLIAHSYMYPDKAGGKAGQDVEEGGKKTRVDLKSGGKATRTSQLRHIVNNERAHPQNRPLWKMSKFEKGAKPSLSTFRTSAGGRKGQRQGDAEARCLPGVSYDGGAICTCSNDPNYDDVAANLYPTTNNDQQPPFTPVGTPKPSERIPVPPAHDGSKDAAYEVWGPPAEPDTNLEKTGHEYFEVGL